MQAQAMLCAAKPLREEVAPGRSGFAAHSIA